MSPPDSRQHLLILSLIGMLLLPAHAGQPHTSTPAFTGNHLPQGRLRNEWLALSPAARLRADQRLRAAPSLGEEHSSLHLDSQGGLFYACTFTLEGVDEPLAVQAPIHGESSDLPARAAAALPVSPFPASLEFSSKPGSQNTLFLDFDGGQITGTVWNTESGQGTYYAMPFDTNGNFSYYSEAEQTAIKRIWQRVAEDYSPFDINVTTKAPATMGMRVAHCMITRTTDQYGVAMPSSVGGGIAYIDVFNVSGGSYYMPALVYYDNLGGGLEYYVAEAASHESGHLFGLYHDGKGGDGYYDGHDGAGSISWAPIMGAGYGKNVTQWSKGGYYQASNLEDDLLILSGKLGYRPDDVGNTIAAATFLISDEMGEIYVTTPEDDPANTNPQNKGILERNTDIDVWKFETAAGSVSLTVAPWVSPANTWGGNVDIRLRLLDATGIVLADINPPLQTSASISTSLSAGVYYLEISNVGAGSPMSNPPTGYTAYGGVGQYFISGRVVPESARALYSANMDENPGWALEGNWEYGAAIGASGDPGTAATGTHLVGYKIGGTYAASLPAQYAITPPIDCRGGTTILLKFRRWLDLGADANAWVDLSTDGMNWTTLWSINSSRSDTQWEDVSLDISSLAAGHSAVQIRWGISSGYLSYFGLRGGWSLDDIEVRALGPLPEFNLLAQASPADWGSVDFTPGGYPYGSHVAVEAIAEPYYVFSGWSGSVISTNNPLILTIEEDISLTAHFVEQVTENTGTPLPWLAGFGFTNDFENAALQTGGNGHAYWESFVAGLDADDPWDSFWVRWSPLPDAPGGEIVWPTVSGRVYTVMYSENILEDFLPLEGAVQLPWTTNSVIDTIHTGRVYRIQVERP